MKHQRKKIRLSARLRSLLAYVQAKLSVKQFLLFSSVLVGVSVGSAAILLKTFAHVIFQLTTIEEFRYFKFIWIFFPFLGILITILLVKYVLKGKLEKGLIHIHFAITRRMSLMPKEQMFAQMLTSSFTVGLGGSAGLEAPIVITGAAFGSNYAQTYRLSESHRTLLLACGVAAGIGAVFNAPIAGVLFALEVLLVDIGIAAFAPLIISAATGALLSEIVLQDDILLSFQLKQPFNYNNLGYYIILGALAGVVSAYHSKVFAKVEGLFSKAPKHIYINLLIGGMSLAGMIFIFPSLFGEGFQGIKALSTAHPEAILKNSIFEQHASNDWVLLGVVGILVMLKSVATGITIGSGGNGGNFAPALFVGSYLGFFLSKLLQIAHIADLPLSNFAIVGMAGILSGLYHAPLTAIFLIAEITGGYTLMIPLMIVASISFAISKFLEPMSLDTRNLGRKETEMFTDRDLKVLVNLRTSQLIETDFQTIDAGDSLRKIVMTIEKSSRNIFPVVDQEDRLLGIILLDHIRGVIFKTDYYDQLLASELMTQPPAFLYASESMDAVMTKFDATGAWNLPVLADGKYVGFISKSKVFSNYRVKLKETLIG